MPKPYPREFRDDVVRVARDRDAGMTLEQVAADFGIHPTTLSKWLRQAAIDEGVKSGVTTSEGAESRELRRRVKLLERENEVLRQAAAFLRTQLAIGLSPGQVSVDSELALVRPRATGYAS